MTSPPRRSGASGSAPPILISLKTANNLQKAAEAFQKQAKHHLHLHHALSRSVTMFQIAIAIGAISALTRRRKFWVVSLAFGSVGLFFLLQSFLAILNR